MAHPNRRFAASAESLQIYQDDFFEAAPVHQSISQALMPSVTPQQPMPAPRAPLGNASGNVVFNPPSIAGKQNSPFKPSSRAMASPMTPMKSQNHQMNSVSLVPPSSPYQMTDSMMKKQPLMSRFKTVAQKPLMDPSFGNYGKENMHPTLYPAPQAPFNINLESYYQKVPGKRTLLEAAPIKEARPAAKKPPKVDDAVLPPHDSFPPIVDDGQKPGHSYAQLIGMSILRAPTRRLTLSQIYKWISDNYSFYNANDSGWQNSIRHNLSLNKAFIKQERPKDDPGKGNYWLIEPGMEHQFMKEKPTKKSQASAENVPVMSTRLEPAHLESDAVNDMPTLPPSTLSAQSPMPSQITEPVNRPITAPPEVSSDATIPLSDSPEEHSDKPHGQDSAADSNAYSPLPAAMHSSPPVPRQHRSNTPPPKPRVLASSGARAHKRKFASMDSAMDDSGYISSLESSAMRPNQASRGLNSEAGRPRIKRGRAEEEIARLRASSYDSPSKGRSYSFVPPSSSPIRQANQMLPPLTPAVKIKPPARPPPSVSPNTNLRMHRDKVNHMLNSPLRRVSSLSDNFNVMEPIFQMDDSFFNFNDFNDGHEFDIFQDSSLDTFFHGFDTDSPIKRSAKRLRPDRTASVNTLGDITRNASNKSVTPVPMSKLSAHVTPLAYETPSKVFEGMSSPSKINVDSPIKHKGDWGSLEDFCAGPFFEENDENCSGLDILQGFEKIGGSGTATMPSSKSAKPGLGRSYTTTF